MFEQIFKNIDDVLHKDAGCGSELDYVEQSSWVLFLKYLDDLEKDRESSASRGTRCPDAHTANKPDIVLAATSCWSRANCVR